MKTTQLVSDPSPLPPSGESPRRGVSTVIEGFADSLYDAASVVRRMEEQAEQHCRHQLASQQRLEAFLPQILNQCQLADHREVNLEAAITRVSQDISKCADQTARLHQRSDALTFNLEQVRLVTDAILQKQQQLVDDFIERRVTDHLFKEFLNIQFALARYSANGNPNLKADILATAEAIGVFLADSGLRIINPEPGVAFKPHEHQPIKVVPAGNGQADGTIAETFTPGLSRSHRVIQQARVAVFKAQGEQQT